MPAITAVIDQANGRAVVQATDLVTSPSSTRTYIRRVYSDGHTVNVRNAEPVPAGNSSYTVSDWEIPPNTSVRYRVSTVAADGTTSNVDSSTPIAWTVPFPYNGRLLHPTIPTLSRKITVSEISELERAVRTEVHYPLGRPDPVTVAQVRQYPTGKVLFLTLSQEDRKAFLLLLTQAAVLCLQTPEGHALGDGELWIAAGTLIEKRTSSPAAITALRIWELAFAQVGRPPGVIADLISRWDAVPPAYATWNAVVAAKATWNEFLIGAELVPSS